MARRRRCHVFILPSAAPGDYPIDCFAPGAATPDGEAIATDCVDGQVSVLSGGPPVAPASLILQKARLRANTAGSGAPKGAILLSGVVNANAPFDGLAGEILTDGVTVAISGAGGVDFPLTWSSAECSSEPTSRGPKIRCAGEDASGKRRLRLRPTRIPNLFKLKLEGLRLTLSGPFTADPVEANLSTLSWQRPDTIDSCTLHRQGALTTCRESGVVP